MAEWLMAADCKSAALCATEVRILPCAPLVSMDDVAGLRDWDCRTEERCGLRPWQQRTDVDCAGCHRVVGGWSLADDGAGEVSIANVDSVRIFCLSRDAWTASFAIGL